MIPSSRLLYALAGFFVLGIVVSIWSDGALVWQWAGAVFCFVALGDLLWLSTQKRLRAERSAPDRAALGVEQEVEITLRNPDRQVARVTVIDTLPDELKSADFPWTGQVPGRGFTSVAVRVMPTGRGPAAFGPVHVEQESPLGFWGRRYRVPVPTEIRIYPNYEPVVRFALLSMMNRQAQMGIRQLNRPGLSREFRQLRDYQDGDTLNRIDWKATSRKLALVSRDYEEQRNQTIILMVDCGRRLRSMDGDVRQFDHCLNALLLLSFIALRQGDRVGVISFGGTGRWLPPVKGVHAMPAILNHLYDYQCGNDPGDFSEAAGILMTREKRRAMVVFCTNLRGEDDANLLKPLALIRSRHLVVMASLQEREVMEKMNAPVESFPDAVALGALHRYADERQRLLSQLRGQGILTLDAPAPLLPVALGNLYLDIKKQGLL